MTYDPMNPPSGGIPADPLPPEIVEGDSSETDQHDRDAGTLAVRRESSIRTVTYQHQSLLWLPDAARAVGINVIELSGWKENKSGYYWTAPNGKHHGYLGDPNGWMWHHTATSAYTPYVRNSKGQTKANLWFGLWRGESNNRLYQSGGGTPTVVFASAGPANYSSGAGRKSLLTDYVAQDRRFYGPQRNYDNKWYGNRYYGNTETVHAGDGSPVDQGVWRIQYMVAGLMSNHYGWSPWRHIGHLDHTRRKIDQRFEQGAPYTIGLMQEATQGYMAGVVVPPEPTPPPGDEDMTFPELPPYAGYNSYNMAALRPNVEVMQRELSGQGYEDPRSTDTSPCKADGYHGPGSQSALNLFKTDKGLTADGTCDDATWRLLLIAE